MKVARFILALAILQALQLHGRGPRMQGPSIELEAFGQRIFIGQAYPSGNVYLKTFSNSISSWPETLSLYSLGNVSAGRSSIRRGTFDRMLVNRTEGETARSVYIPAAEGMDPDHRFCGMGETIRPNPLNESVSKDFFQTVFDHCASNAGVVVYRTERSSYSVMVIGVAGVTSVTNPQVILEKSLRPLMATEKQEVDRQKAESAKTAGRLECSTIPAFLDAAVKIFEASMPEENLTFRVSAYEDPGCGGHLRAVYILDLVRAGQLLKKFELNQYQGAI
jgi:hypothetical protein